MTLSFYLCFALMTVSFVFIDIWQTQGKQVTVSKAAMWSLFWFILAFAFAASIYMFWDVYAPYSEYSNQKATVSFITGYLLEKSLSVDNLFIFAIIFQQYKVPNHLRPRALLLGVVGAMVLRGLMIALGGELLSHYHWVIYVFAVFLIWTGIHLAKSSDEQESVNPLPEQVMRRLFSVTSEFKGRALFIKSYRGWIATPMFIVIGVIAFMDLMFALDSIPAIFAVTREPVLVLAANIFALLGLRSLYFVLQGMMDKFTYLKPALSFIMVFIGVKMMLVGSEWEIPTYISLSVLLMSMIVAIIASVIRQQTQPIPDVISNKIKEIE